MKNNPLLRYFIHRPADSDWQTNFVLAMLGIGATPICVVLSGVNDRDFLPTLFACGAVCCLPFLLMFPIGMAFIGAGVTATFTRRMGSFDLLRLTRLANHDIVHAFVLNGFYQVRGLLILLVVGLLGGIIAFQLNDDAGLASIGLILYIGLGLLNPMATLIGIVFGLRVHRAESAAAFAIALTVALMVLMGIGFWFAIGDYWQSTIYTEAPHLRETAFAICLLPIALILGGSYLLAVRFIRRPDIR